MGKLHNLFKKSAVDGDMRGNVKRLYELAAADGRAIRAYGVDEFSQYRIFLQEPSRLLQVTRNKDGAAQASIQGECAGFVDFESKRFMELLKQF